MVVSVSAFSLSKLMMDLLAPFIEEALRLVGRLDGRIFGVGMSRSCGCSS